jgi:hypothetical protein
MHGYVNVKFRPEELVGQLLYLKDYEGLFISRIKTVKIQFKQSLQENTEHFILYATFV